MGQARTWPRRLPGNGAPGPVSRGERPDYGLDAPGIMFGLLAAGAALCLAAAAVGDVWPGGGSLAAALAVLLLVAGVVPLMLGCSMAAYGALGKMRARDLMLGRVPWAGDEQVLDIGTGAGLLLIGAAKHLTTGSALGIDLWSSKDLTNNAPSSAERNIQAEGVADRARVITGDARALPIADGTVDRVLSLLCLHNIEPKAEQRRACQEIARVLKPGGVALIGDYVPTTGYAHAFADAGLTVVSSRGCHITALGPLWIVQAGRPVSR